MKRNTQTTIDKLQIGDRFYKAADRKKQVFTKVEGKTKVTNYQTYKNHALQDGQQHPVDLKSSTAVIFLRHASVSTQDLQQ